MRQSAELLVGKGCTLVLDLDGGAAVDYGSGRELREKRVLSATA